MTDPDRYRDAEPSAMGRWLRVAGIAAVMAVLLLVVVLLVGGGREHGPSRHSVVPLPPQAHGARA